MGKKTALFLMNFLFIIFSINFISSQYVWDQYGGGLNSKWDAQYPDGYGRLDSDPSNISMAYGQNLAITQFPYQPLVTYINTSLGLDSYLILQDGNYLQIYDKNLNLESEIYAGVLMSNLDSLFYTNDTTKRNIAGVYKYNNTLFQLKIYTYNHTTSNLSLSHLYNFTTTYSLNVAGIRHSGGNILFVNGNPDEFFRVNESSGVTRLSLFGGGVLFEPLAFSDMNNDGNIEYMSFNANRLYIWNEDGSIVFNYNSTFGIDDAKIFAPDGYASSWKVAIAESYDALIGGTTWKYSNRIIVKKLDGTTLWDVTDEITESPVYAVYKQRGRLAITDDYDGDGKSDIYASFFVSRNLASTRTNNVLFLIRKGTNGASLLDVFPSLNTDDALSDLVSLTISDLNHDGYDDFLYSTDQVYNIYNPQTTSSYFFNNLSSENTICIPADLNLDGFIEVVCSGDTSTYVYSSGLINSNPTIDSVTYDSGTTIQINETLYSTVTASDNESNSIKYNVKCSNTDSWGTEQASNILICSYGSVGIYNHTVGVKDDYHSSYTTHSQDITVTLTGTSCNNNGLCESGENYLNCPNDCDQPTTNQTYTQTIGGMSIPNKIVDIDNTEQGLLPEIYYGILAFLSNTLSPMIILIFVIFSVMIILTIGTIIMNIAKKVGN